MAERTFDSESLVTLPNLTAKEALALAVSLEAAAKHVEEKEQATEPTWALPSAIQGTRTKLKNDTTVLRSELGVDVEEEEDTRVADLNEDNAVGALFDNLASHRRLPATKPSSVLATKINAILFPTGLQFLKLRYRQEWAEVQVRLDKIAKEKIDSQTLDEAIRSLGGGAILDHLIETHTEYGRALGVTAHAETPVTPQIRAAAQAVLSQIRKYVVKVSASVEDDDQGSEDRAKSLLAPIQQAMVTRSKKSVASPSSPPPPPVPPARLERSILEEPGAAPCSQ